MRRHLHQTVPALSAAAFALMALSGCEQAPEGPAPSEEAAYTSRSDRLALLVGSAAKAVALDQIKGAVIEVPVKSVIENSAAVPPPAPRAPRADGGKRIIELGPKNVVRVSQPTPTAPVRPTPPVAKQTDAENPIVKPGEVKWHASFQAACEAAKKSGKPVLLFHMMGQLDRQFC
jgi:hypothetical protein